MRPQTVLPLGFLLVCLLFTSTVSLYAQRFNRAPEVRWGVRAGFNMSDLTGTSGLDRFNGLAFYNDQKQYVGFYDTKAFQYGFNAGIAMQIRCSDNIWVEPSLIYNTKGYLVEDKGININAHFNYLTLPLVAIYKYELNDDLRLFAEGGWFFGAGVGGHTIFQDDFGSDVTPRAYRQESTNPKTYDPSVHGRTFFWYDKDATFETKGTYRFDTGLQIGFGVEWWRFKFNVSYQLSTVPIYNYGEDYSERYLSYNDTVTTNSFNYFQVDIPECPRHQVLSFTITYFLDNLFIPRRW